MTTQEKKSFLRIFRAHMMEADATQDRIRQLNVRGARLMRDTELYNPDEHERLLESIAQQKIDAMQRLTMIRIYQTRAEDAIDRLANPTQRTVMRLRYIDSLTWYQIENIVMYARTQLWRIHDQALRTMTIPDGWFEIEQAG